ncbi:hypothetical protein ABFG93_05225 [Pseudalkalibacillus hwajinpoensis]|uniref:hypothetical protein n=1 Tax=Guptibacillus hwajinpoensis TaxID=208199 RepID=UPI00325B991F
MRYWWICFSSMDNKLSNRLLDSVSICTESLDAAFGLQWIRMDPLAPSNLEFFITGRNDERRRKYGKERYYLGFKVYDDVIQAGQESGEFSRKYSSATIARSIVSFIDGLALDHAILPEEDIHLKEQSILFVEYLKMALEVE